MIVVTSPHLYIPKHDDITVFLAGGISGCRDWQQEVINNLFRMIDKDDSQVIVYNPRRKEFDVDDLGTVEDQITWEFQYLNKVDIFSMYFVGGDQIQPICLYELGRYTKKVFGYGQGQVISVEKDYIRERDVVVQVALATSGVVPVNLNATPYEHAEDIVRCIRQIKEARIRNSKVEGY